jgi:integrase/recombinase XerD
MRTWSSWAAPAEVDALMAALFTHRDRAMVAAMVLGGLRRCEVLGLRMGGLHVAERRVFVAEGKGGRQRLVPVSGRFFAVVAAYLDAERPPGAPAPARPVRSTPPGPHPPLTPIPPSDVFASQPGDRRIVIEAAGNRSRGRGV